MAFSRETLDIVGRRMVEIIQEELSQKKYVPAGFYGQPKTYNQPTNKIATGGLRDSVDYEVLNRGGNEYQDWVVEIRFRGKEQEAFYVNNGSRSPFRARPPKSVISAWIDVRGISVPGLNKEQLTYAIMNSIKSKGIKPTGFIERSEDRMINELAPLLEQEAIDDIEEILDQLVFILNDVE
jgi:hypothetical protein